MNVFGMFQRPFQIFRFLRRAARVLSLVPLAALLALAQPALAQQAAAEQKVDFNHEVRPILMKYCAACHGGVKQAGDVSFVYAEQVLPPEGWIVEPGDPEASVLIERIKTDDAELRMPPVDEHPEPLPAEAVRILERWIEEGAIWGDHWSLAPLMDPNTMHTRAIVSSRAGASWGRGPLDRVVAAGHDAADLKPAIEASAEEWLRRVTLDLTGLPPSPELRVAFLNQCDKASTAAARDRIYERYVGHLLSNPAFGERWASVWMDLARYADSKGFEKDPHRDMWPYRDWLIDAFNADMPYDEFTVKQLAGDLLTDSTAENLIATAFHRNTQTNTEGGTDDEEFRIAAVIDRVNTTWTVWQATTIGCVQCHSHPYDPLRHEEYYAFMALLNDTLDTDLDSDFPTLVVPADRAEIPAAVERQRGYQRARKNRNQLGSDLMGVVDWQPLTPNSVASTGGDLEIRGSRVRRAGGTFPVGVRYTIEADAVDMTALRIDIYPESDDPAKWPEQGSVLSHVNLQLIEQDGTASNVELQDVFVDALTVPDDPRKSLIKEGNPKSVGGYPKLNGPRSAVFVFKERLQPNDSSKLRLEMTQSASVTGNIATPLRHFQWSSTDDSRWSELLESEQLRDRTELLEQAKQASDAIRGVSLPIVDRRPNQVARATRVFIRGNWTERGDEIAAGIPGIFADISEGDRVQIANRLAFANWLVSTENPLSARVWANRIWAQLFGIGIVETLEDFGSSGQLPSDPALLDQLAMLLRDQHQWRLKPFLREIVLSSTYRQTNQQDKSSYERDPKNRRLARGPRTRLSAEMVRDQALAASGLLVDQSGGASVMPPQPDGVWQTVYSGAQWKTAVGGDRYRRALYTYWRRTSPYPSLLMFDSPTRDLCSARRIPTNTPLQALVTLNDPVFVECSQSLANRASEFHPGDPAKQIAWMCEAVTQRSPNAKAVTALESLYADLLADTEVATGSQGDGETTVESESLAAMSLVANTIFNLDWALTK